jgi:hypothetical protein
MLKRFGSTVDRLFLQKTIAANGRSFISVSAGLPGGLGAAIALPPSSKSLIPSNPGTISIGLSSQDGLD